ncbi:MAG: flagellar assembly factor FliW [Acidimicrobiales bacterium]
MKVSSTRLGELDLDDEQIYDLGPGILGFPEGRSYAVIEIDDDYFWIQSVEDAETAFLAMHPWSFFPDYELDVPDDVLAEIGLDDPTESAVYLLLTTNYDGDDLTDVTANLLGPIIVNNKSRCGRQIVLNTGDYTTKEPLVVA